MYNISQELKDKLNSNAIISTARMTFSNPHFVIDGSNLVSVKIKDYCYNEGRIIGTNIAKDVEIIIQNDNYNLQDKEFFLEIGVLLDNNDYEYIPYGYYIIDTVEDTKSNNQYKITAMDYMIKLNTDFVEFDTSEYPMTMRTFLNKFAQQYGIELAEQTLPNETLEIPSIPYFTKASGRSVLKNMAEVFGRFAKFNRLGKLEFRLKNETDEKITKANMNSKLEADNQYGEVNVVSILLSDDVTGENATLRDEESIAIYGENIIKIVGNEFLSTAELRETAVVELFNDLKGFKYIPTSFKYMGKPYLDCGDGIQVQGMNGEYYESIVLNNYIEVPALRQSKMENLALTKVQVQQQYIPELEKRIGRAEFNVDKVEKKITLVVEEQTSQSTQINNVASNLNTFINETYSNDISNLQDQIDGAIQFWNGEAIPTLSNYPANEWTTEEQRNNHRADIYTVIEDVDGEMKQGKSYRFDKVGTTWQWVELTDNELSAVQALASSKAKVYVTTPTVPYNVGDLWLKDEELYECITAKDATGSYSASDWVKATKYTDDTKANEVADGLAQTNTKVSTIEQNLDGITERVEATETGIRENTQSINQLENEILLTDTFERQKDFQIDAAENILTDVKVYGELEQDVSTTGKNKFGYLDKDWTSQTYKYIKLPKSDTNYTLALKLKEGKTIPTGLYFGFTMYGYYNENQSTRWLLSNSTFASSSSQKDSFYYINNLSTHNYISFYDGSTTDVSTFLNEYFDIQLQEGTEFDSYEEFIPNKPTPEYEARISVAGGVINLFNNSVGGNAGEFLNEDGKVTTGNENLRYTDYIKLPFDAKKLAVSGMTSSMNLPAICFYNKDKEFISGVAYANAGTKIIDVPKNSYFFRTSYRTINTKFQIEKGIIIHDYIEPNTRGIFYDNIGRNYFEFSKTIALYSTITVVTKEKNTLQIKGTANTYRYYRVALKVKAGTYTFQRKWKFISGDNTNGMTGVVLINQGFNGPQLLHLAKTVNSKSFTVTEDTELDITFYISGNVALTSETEIQFYDIQIEKGKIATIPELYKENNAVITLPENEFMGKIGDYEDYIEGNILHKKIGTTILDGTEEVVSETALTNTVRFHIGVIDNFKYINKEISTHFQFLYDWSTDEQHFYISETSHNIWLFIDKTIASTADELKAYLAEQYANGTPVTFYYVLGEEYTRQIDRYTLPTMKGINNISVSAPLSATYYTNVDINSALTSKAEYAEQVIKVDEISTRVSSTETTIANQSVDISSINDNIGSLNNSVSANQQEITVIKEDYTDLRQTVEGFDFTVVDRIQQQIANGEITSNVVKTTTVAIDADGIKVAKSGSEMQSLLDNEGFYVNKGEIDKTETKNNILTVDKDGVVTENLYVRTYLTAGYHRTEGYIENGEKRTGVFYQGGVDD